MQVAPFTPQFVIASFSLGFIKNEPSQSLPHPRSNLPALSKSEVVFTDFVKNSFRLIGEGRLLRRLFPSNTARTSLVIHLRLYAPRNDELM